MEAVLLGFCVLTLIFSSMIIVVELVRDRYRRRSQTHRFLFKKDETLKAKKSTLSTEQSTNTFVAQNTERYFEFLKKELVPLGYRSYEQQVKFINWILHTQHTQFSNLSAQELKKVLIALQHYKVQQQKHASPMMPQSA
ncbi:hypothetical protein WDW89_16455 [Deltaproteobacteria bacterium TL4]